MFVSTGWKSDLRRAVAGACVASVAATAANAGGTAPAAWSAAIPCLSGFVRDPGGGPVRDSDLDFFNSAGMKLVTPGDNTDATGFYTVCVLPDIYRVTFAPPPGTRLLGKEVFGVDLTADQGRALDVTLQPGTVLSGLVTAAGGGPLANVDIDVDGVTSGGRVFTPGDASDAAGNYRVVVPDGTYRVRLSPPPGSRWRGAQFDMVVVQGDRRLDAVLQPGVLLSGTVRDPQGGGVGGIQVELREADGTRVFTANNRTGADGRYQIAVPQDTFTVRFTAPPGDRYVSVLQAGVVIAADATLDAVLESGVLLGADVHDAGSHPIAGVDIDVIDSATGQQVFTPNDRTDTAGRAALAVRPGTYDIEFNPPVGTPFDRLRLDAVAVARDTVLDIDLGTGRRARVLGRVADARGAPLAGIVVVARRPGGDAAFIPSPASDSTGGLDLSITVGSYDVFAEPPRGAPYAGAALGHIPVVADTTWGEIRLADGVVVTAQVADAASRGVAGADLDFRTEPGAIDVFTPHDDSDVNGVAIVTVPAGVYAITVTPPPGSPLAATTLAPVAIGRDTMVTLTVAPTVTATSRLLGFAVPNPFQRSVRIPFDVPVAAATTLAVYDVRGRLVRVLESGLRPASRFDASWDGTDAAGKPLASGVYVLRMRTGARADQRKIVLLR